jgi:hypothetical protein
MLNFSTTHIGWRIFKTLVLIMLLLAMPTCSLEDRTFQAQKRLVDASEQLDATYVRVDVGHARECLKRNAALLEGATILEPFGRSVSLATVYSRLYVLEKRATNNPAAEASLIKVRFWFLKSRELSGDDAGHALAKLNELDSGKLIEIVDQLDRKQNGGRLAAYVESVGK